MEAEALTEDLGRLAGLGPDNGDNVLRDIVCEHVNSLTSLIRDNKGDAYKDDDVYDDLGGFIVNWARLGLKLAERLSDDKDVNKLATARIDKEIELTDGSETKVLDETQNKRKILKSMVELLRRNEQAVQATWGSRNRRERVKPESGSTSSSPLSSNDSSAWSILSPYDDRSRFETDSRSPDALTYKSTGNGLENLHKRGRGEYTCPYGDKCEKGGYQDGKMVIFSQNSSFIGHLHKHGKPYKCDLPNCTNKTGFARRDQLQRHKRDVSH